MCMYQHGVLNDEEINDEYKDEEDESEEVDNDKDSDDSEEIENNDIDRTFVNPSQSEESDSSTTSAKKFKCRKCEYRTSSEDKLRDHNEKYHHQCSVCCYVFLNKTQLQRATRSKDITTSRLFDWTQGPGEDRQ